MAAAVEVVVADVEAAVETKYFAGLSWRPAFAAGVLAHSDEINALEVMAENYFSASTHELDTLAFLATQIPLTLHGVSMGLCSTERLNISKLKKFKELLHIIPAKGWSEHLSFVRHSAHEIGHMAAPPRTRESITASIENINRASDYLGSKPILENIATLADPPCSQMSESEWIREIIEGADCYLLLDLHNIYANTLNFGQNLSLTLKKLPLERVRIIHLSGGRHIQEHSSSEKTRLLDDHLHDPPEILYSLLEKTLKQIGSQNIHVIIERDGKFPPFSQMLHQIRKVRNVFLNVSRNECNAVST